MLAVTEVRLFAFCIPVITALPAFDATVSAPSGIPFVGWAVDAVFLGGSLLLFACARLLLPLHPTPSTHPSCGLCHQLRKCCAPGTVQGRKDKAGPSLPSRQTSSLPCSQPHLPPFQRLHGRLPFRAHQAV